MQGSQKTEEGREMRTRLSRLKPAVLGLAFLLILSSSAYADPIGPGFDLFETQKGTQVTIPGLGRFTLAGAALDPTLGNTDTIVQRLAGTDFPGGIGTVPLQLYALNLRTIRGIAPKANLINLRVIGGTSLGVPEPIGEMTISQFSPAIGGQFSSSLPINALVTATRLDGTVVFQGTLSATLTSSGNLWSSTPAHGYPSTSAFPAGNFYPLVDPRTGAAVVGQESGSAFSETHVITPSSTIAAGTPEIDSTALGAAATLLVGGVVTLRGRRRDLKWSQGSHGSLAPAARS
jgi:hypothetical protein